MYIHGIVQIIIAIVAALVFVGLVVLLCRCLVRKRRERRFESIEEWRIVSYKQKHNPDFHLLQYRIGKNWYDTKNEKYRTNGELYRLKKKLESLMEEKLKKPEVEYVYAECGPMIPKWEQEVLNQEKDGKEVTDQWDDEINKEEKQKGSETDEDTR